MQNGVWQCDSWQVYIMVVFVSDVDKRNAKSEVNVKKTWASQNYAVSQCHSLEHPNLNLRYLAGSLKALIASEDADDR